MIRIGAAVRTQRKFLGMIQNDLAQASGVSVTTIGKIERGANTTIVHLAMIADGLDLFLHELIEMAEKEQ